MSNDIEASKAILKRAFDVAASMRVETLQVIHQAFGEAIAGGWSLNQLKETLAERLAPDADRRVKEQAS